MSYYCRFFFPDVIITSIIEMKKFPVMRFLEMISRAVLRENARPTGGPSASYRIPTPERGSARGGTIYPRYIGCNAISQRALG